MKVTLVVPLLSIPAVSLAVPLRGQLQSYMTTPSQSAQAAQHVFNEGSSSSRLTNSSDDSDAAGWSDPRIRGGSMLSVSDFDWLRC
jgi:hypothetical protein